VYKYKWRDYMRSLGSETSELKQKTRRPDKKRRPRQWQPEKIRVKVPTKETHPERQRPRQRSKG